LSPTIPLRGVLVPETTPFDQQGELDGAAFRANVRAHLKAGVSGIVTAGSTGEAPLLEDDERLRLVELARELVTEGQWVIAGTGSESTRTTIWRSRDAAANGADAVLVVAPHYYGGQMSPAALEAHYREVAEESTVPVVLYNIPKYAHFALDREMVGRLAKHPNVIGIKDSSGDPESLRGYLAAQSDAFTVLTGSGSGFLSALDAGARGGILAVATFAAPAAMRLFEAFHAKDRGRAEQAQAMLAPLAKEIIAARGPAGVKTALDAVGLHGGPVRSPLASLAGEDAEAVALMMRGVS
jgi:4-hydroxy-2-oxoglutarate aldolase